MPKTNKTSTNVAPLYINNYSSKLIRRRSSSRPSEFFSVSFRLADHNKFGSFCVPTSCVHDAKRKDKSIIDGFCSIFLGTDPDRIRTVSVRSEDDPSVFDIIEMKTSEILSMIQADRQAYTERVKAEAV